MVGTYRTHEALEAAWKYFILGSVGIALPTGRRILLPTEEARDFFHDVPKDITEEAVAGDVPQSGAPFDCRRPVNESPRKMFSTVTSVVAGSRHCSAFLIAVGMLWLWWNRLDGS